MQRLDPKIQQQQQTKKISHENLPSINTRTDEPGDERSSVDKEKDTTFFAKAVDGMMDLTRIENGDLNKIHN